MNQLPSYLQFSDNPSDVIEGLKDKWQVDHIAILVDENTQKHCLPLLNLKNTEVVEIQSGEIHKTLQTCEALWKALTDLKFSRKSMVLNLGGGVIGDMGGFVASTYKRGIKFINLPTTLLSQVDASIGGKLGIDFGSLKNHIGVFKEPDQVIINTHFLQTLPDRELRSGFAEVIKHALIADSEHWNYLKDQDFNKLDWNKIIPKSVAIKNQVVESDPLENGLRKVLNFGHTLGHAIESFLLQSSAPLLHGEAIGVGMILESHLSYQKDWITSDQLNEITSFIIPFYSHLPKHLPDLEEIYSYLLQDKKNDALGINFSLIKGIGGCEFDQKVSQDMISLAIDYYQDLYK